MRIIQKIAMALLVPFVGAFFRLFIPRKLKEWEDSRFARNAFRSAFSDALSQLMEHNNSLAEIIRNSRPKHLTAIQDFRPHLGRHRQCQFDKTKQEYDQCCELAEPNSVTPKYAFVKTNPGKSQEYRKQMITVIQELISYTE